MNVPKPSKVVRRSVAVALGIVCILLIALIVYLIVAGTPAENDYNNLQNQNKQLQAWLHGNETLLNQTLRDNTNLQTQLNSLNNTVNDLNNVVNDLNNTVNLNKTQTWVVDHRLYNANSSNEWVCGPIDYAGYIEVEVESNTTNAYVRVSYGSTWYGVNYDNQIVVGPGYSASLFPVLPTSNIIVRVGNLNLSDGALIWVDISYHY